MSVMYIEYLEAKSVIKQKIILRSNHFSFQKGKKQNKSYWNFAEKLLSICPQFTSKDLCLF